MNVRDAKIISRNRYISPRHGHVFSPPSRAWYAYKDGLLDEGALNQREAGKFFPATEGNLQDPTAPSDVMNFAPPPDGKIASANQATGAVLDEPGANRWKKNDVQSGDPLDVSWHYSAAHVTRRWNYFITKEGWDPAKQLSRAQFEATPFFKVENEHQPYWSHTDELMPVNPTTHSLPLPQRTGYHVLLAVWEVANTGNAFYQVIDLNFLSSGGGGDKPDAPTNLRAEQVTDKKVVLAWNAPADSSDVATYRVFRDGIALVDVAAPQLTFTDYGVAPETRYSYTVAAINVNGNASNTSNPVVVNTLAEGGLKPTAPVDLHSMDETTDSITLMWGHSVSPSPIEHYIIYRDGVEIARVAGDVTTYKDSGLDAGTVYNYYAVALAQSGEYSGPSNILNVSTLNENGQFPAWSLNKQYKVDDIVSHAGKNWICIQDHTSLTADWAPGVPGSETLWNEYKK